MQKTLLIKLFNSHIDNSNFLPELIHICNNEIENENLIIKTARYIESEWKYLSEDVQIPVQVIAAQLKSIVAWRKIGLDIGRYARLSLGKKQINVNDKRSCNFLVDSLTSKKIRAAKAEGEKGYFWRGYETLRKMKGNLVPDLFKIHGSSSNIINQVLYCMNHGIVECPNNLLESTRKKEISTLHDTYFSKNCIRESNQYLGTGHGHFQGVNLDIKQVISGIGYQIVVYFEEGNENPYGISINKIKKDDWILVPPGTKDYMVSIENFRFMDFSIRISNKFINKINPIIKNIEKLQAQVEKFNICPKIIIKPDKRFKSETVISNYNNKVQEMPLPTLCMKEDENIINFYGKLGENPEEDILKLIKS